MDEKFEKILESFFNENNYHKSTQRKYKTAIKLFLKCRDTSSDELLNELSNEFDLNKELSSFESYLNNDGRSDNDIKKKCNNVKRLLNYIKDNIVEDSDSHIVDGGKSVSDEEEDGYIEGLANTEGKRIVENKRKKTQNKKDKNREKNKGLPSNGNELKVNKILEHNHKEKNKAKSSKMGLKDNLDSSNNEILEFKDLLSDYDNRIKSLENALNNSIKDFNHKEKEIIFIRHSLDRNNDKIRSLENSLNNYVTELKRSNDNIMELNRFLIESNNKLNSYEEELNDKNNEIKKLKESLENNKDRNKNIMEDKFLREKNNLVMKIVNGGYEELEIILNEKTKKLYDKIELLEDFEDYEVILKHMDSFIEGINIAYKNLNKVLESEGLKEIPTKGSKFNSTLHKADKVENIEDIEDGYIIEELRKGYTIGDNVVKKASVKVCKK